MSGSSIPYHIRQHKAVDRRLFLDLLARLERWQSLKDYAYISMGAYPLEDHKQVFRHLGLTKLISFDLDPTIVARQRFNIPVNSCRCIERASADLVDNLEAVLEECEIEGSSKVIVWLDYTAPKEIGTQLREFEALLNNLGEGDIVRLTLNANPDSLFPAKRDNGENILTEKVIAKRLERLTERIGDYLPSWVEAQHMTEQDLPQALSEAVGKAALNAFPASDPKTFTPLSIVRYADGQQMLTVTGVVHQKAEADALLAATEFSDWPFYSGSWSEVNLLLVPALTPRERLFFERAVLTDTPASIAAEIGFSQIDETEVGTFLENYRKYCRFYPTLLTAEL
ncbi:O-methyltransferase [Pseudokordiimonas caeni]|uniref:O-methyltransferase n=1 Tax=Pseudokordiimonas caeni TaxID=2997908 RepID=UPI002810C709|nr:O-methyltransferase [Pseudokordiimonas caeni]